MPQTNGKPTPEEDAMSHDTSKPTPGSREAGEMGCTCPISDNCFGKGYRHQEGVFLTVSNCPVHATHMVSMRPVEEPEKLEPVDSSTVVDLLGLASRYAREVWVEAWTQEQREDAADWAAVQHLIASDNDDVERLPMPPHVDALPTIGFCGPEHNNPGWWISELRYPDGSEETWRQRPGMPETFELIAPGTRTKPRRK